MIKKIREARNKSKKFTYNNILSPPSVREVENDLEKIRFGDLINVIKKLEISLEEFIYYFNDTEIKNVNDIRDIKNFIKNKEINQLIAKYQEYPRYFYTLKCIDEINNNNFEKARSYAESAWFYLREYDELFPNDLFCLSHIFIMFKGEHFYEVCDKIQKDMVKWRKFGDFYKVEIVFLLNKGRYLEEYNLIEEAIICYENAKELALEFDVGSYVGISLYRIGSLRANNLLIQQAENILELFNKDLLKILQRDYDNRTEPIN